MATLTKNWEVGGGTFTITYSGSGDGTITISSSVNEGKDRYGSFIAKTLDGLQSKTVYLFQPGLREIFNTTDKGAFAVTDGEFLVLK